MTPILFRAARLSAALLSATTLLALPAHAAPPPPGSDLELRRSQLRNLNVQQQNRMEQRLRCINAASSLGELEVCERSRYTPGMGGWGCPMW